MQESLDRGDANFADFYKVSGLFTLCCLFYLLTPELGLRGVYLASQLAEGVTGDSLRYVFVHILVLVLLFKLLPLRPPNLTTLISFDSGAKWQPIQVGVTSVCHPHYDWCPGAAD